MRLNMRRDFNKTKNFQATCPNQLGMQRNFGTRLIRILWDIRTYRDHRKNSPNTRTPKMKIFPGKCYETAKTQLGCSKHNGTSSNSRIRIIAPLWHLRLAGTIPRIFPFSCQALRRSFSNGNPENRLNAKTSNKGKSKAWENLPGCLNVLF